MTPLNETPSFGSYLNELLTLRGIDKKHFSDAMNINRSLLYRFLSSEQLPDTKQLDEISQKLNLRASEQRKLFESYECTLYGWEIVSGRKLIKNMLNSLDTKTHENGITYEYSLKSRIFTNENPGVTPVKNKVNVINTLLYLLDSIRQSPEVSTARLILQPDIQDFVNILAQVLNETADSKRDISMKHVIRFKDTLLKKNKLHNLKILSYLLPLSPLEKKYKVYYSTKNLSSDTYETFFPNFISIDSKTAFVFSEDYEKGLLYTSQCPEVIELLNEEFNKICNDCLPLFYDLENYENQSLYMYEYENMLQADTSLLHPENGFYTFPIGVMEQKVEQGVLPKEHAQVFIKRMKTFRERLKKNNVLEIISPLGLQNFAATGRLRIYGDIEFSKSERIEVLKNLLSFVKEEGNYTLYLMKEESPFYNLDFAIYTIGSDLLYITPSFTGFKMTDNITIRNRGIVESFTDFMHSGFTEHNSIIEQEEVATVISDIIKNL